jgi:hypothetical protein
MQDNQSPRSSSDLHPAPSNLPFSHAEAQLLMQYSSNCVDDLQVDGWNRHTAKFTMAFGDPKREGGIDKRAQRSLNVREHFMCFRQCNSIIPAHLRCERLFDQPQSFSTVALAKFQPSLEGVHFRQAIQVC